MTTYPRSAYGPDPHAGASRNNAKARGWGDGWPNCSPGKMAVASGGGASVRCRKEIVPLVSVLLAATALSYKLKPAACGAYNCRPIAGTKTPSNHSWGLAIDINWNDNPMSSTFHSTIPLPVVHMWEDCGFYWGGRYRNRPDTMHFEFLDRAGDVHLLAAKAALYLGGKTPPKQTTHSGVPDVFPGRFTLGQLSPWVTVMGRRFKALGFDQHHDGDGYQPGPTFTRYDLANAKDFQASEAKLKGDVDGYLGPLGWLILGEKSDWM